MACIRRASLAARRENMHVELGELSKEKELTERQERNRLHMATRNGAWLSAVTRRLNRMELSQEEFRENLCLRYGLIPQDIPTICDGCGKKFLIEHALS